MLTSDTTFLLSGFLNDGQLNHTIKALIEDPDIKRRSYTTENNSKLHIFNAAKSLHSPRNHYHMLAKGLVVSEGVDGNYRIVSIPLTKFYNTFEEVAKQDLQNVVGSDLFVKIIKKYDGTLINRFVHEGKVMYATRSVILDLDNSTDDLSKYKQSPKFFRDYVNSAMDLSPTLQLLNNPRYLPESTLHFELVGPQNIILENYESAQLIYLSETHHKKLETTGPTEFSGMFYASPHPQYTNVHKDSITSFNKLSDLFSSLASTYTGAVEEGFIISVNSTSEPNSPVRYRFKVKTSKYLELLSIKNSINGNFVLDSFLEHRQLTSEGFVENYLKKNATTKQLENLEELTERVHTIWVADNIQGYLSRYLDLEGAVDTWVKSSRGVYDSPRAEYAASREAWNQYAGIVVKALRGQGTAYGQELYSMYRKLNSLLS